MLSRAGVNQAPWIYLAKQRRLSPAPDVHQVSGQPAGHKENGVDANVVARPRVTRRKPFGGDGDATKAIFVERHGRSIFTAPLLDLDERDRPSAFGDQVDFSSCNARTSGEDSPAVKTQPPCGERFRSPPAGFRNVAVQALPAKSSALA